jgi:uncharacterized RDD family membrane protein YckC
MDRSISVRTPESIAFSYELAGLGSRFLALAIDMLWQIGTLMLISWALFAAATHVPDRARASVTISGSIAVAIVVAVLFVVFFGYFIAFEAFWNGQTPGKKLLGIRVVRDGGYPLDLAGSFIRNLIRIGELVAGFYAISAVVTLLSPENKRLGDLAAGTIVVRDARAQSLAAIRENAAADSRRIALLNGDEHALVARFIARRADIAPQHRRALAAQIADRLRSRVSSDLQRLDDEDLLERING